MYVVSRANDWNSERGLYYLFNLIFTVSMTVHRVDQRWEIESLICYIKHQKLRKLTAKTKIEEKS